MDKGSLCASDPTLRVEGRSREEGRVTYSCPVVVPGGKGASRDSELTYLATKGPECSRSPKHPPMSNVGNSRMTHGPETSPPRLPYEGPERRPPHLLGRVFSHLFVSQPFVTFSVFAAGPSGCPPGKSSSSGGVVTVPGRWGAVRPSSWSSGLLPSSNPNLLRSFPTSSSI